MRVLKFGGSSVVNAEKILRVKEIVERKECDTVVVVSAFGGVTDKLSEISRMACTGDIAYKEELLHTETRHLQTIDKLHPNDKSKREEIAMKTKILLKELNDFLHGVFLIHELTEKTLDYILSFGERLSATIISSVIEEAYFADARKFILADENYGKAKVDFETTNLLIRQYFTQSKGIPVVPGFIANNHAGITTTLGRGGSDYTAAILASALQVEMLEIWTDVNGFMTADPRKVKKAYSIERLSYAEAMELSHFGAKVIYTPTVQPAYKAGIPIVIKNTLNPQNAGTTISMEAINGKQNQIKGISSIDKVSLITVHGSGLVGTRGLSMRLFGALAQAGVNIILISQASSEYSISLAISPEDVPKAQKAIQDEFEAEIEYWKNIKIKIEDGLSILAIVGENMKNTPGVAANLFNSLGRNGVNVVAIAQGSSELNISAVIPERSLKKALNVVHEGFFLSDYIDLHLFQIGIGTVGSDLLKQIESQQEMLLKEHKLKINLVGLANSKKMIFNEEGIDINNFREQLNESKTKSDIGLFVKKMSEMNLRNSVFIDCTASKEISEKYKQVLNAYISVVAANKIACSSEYKHYEALKNISIKKGKKFLYEANVGAGLPIIKTINDLIKSGDKILKLEAVLSGTLNFIFNTISENVPLSEAIRLAKEKGFSEPDPREDLCGIDVLRKLLILARESGYKIEMNEIENIPFLPEKYLNTESLDEFWEQITALDNDFEQKRKKSAAENKRWRYVATLENGKAKIQLMEIGSQHPFFQLAGSDNIILIWTERYKKQPLQIKGAGAGAAVTASGVFADIISIVNI